MENDPINQGSQSGLWNVYGERFMVESETRSRSIGIFHFL